MNHELAGCGVRAILTPEAEDLFKKTILEKSNYVIYEMEL